MEPIFPVTADIALHGTAGTRAIEQRTAMALPPHALMHRAGESVARLALAIAPHADRIWIAAGPGNNGGDGLEAAARLRAAGKQVEVSLLGDPARLPADAADAFERAKSAGVAISDRPQPSAPAAIAIDALLGVGASRAPADRLAEAVRALNALSALSASSATGVPVLAVDLPSGLHATTGQALGRDCVVASHTLALLTAKPGLFTADGRDHAGEIWLETLGAASGLAPTPIAWLSGVPKEAFARRRHAQHKGSFGDVAIVGGGPGMHGAALMAARAAHAAGAGRTYVAMLDRSAAAPTLDPVRPELMFRGDWLDGDLAAIEHSTVVCGCGGGDAVRAVMPRLLGHAWRLVIDADALNVLAVDASLTAMVRARADHGLATVLTPHPLEAARLLGCDTAEVQRDRLAAAQSLADRYACTAVLKGSGSVISSPGEIPRINSTGNAALATAGTGDVLAGWLGGRWTQRARGDEAATAFRVARQAVAEHGAAAEPPPRDALLASDLIERLYRG